jgi:cytochrome bd ubiquinol oxidase subunit II
MTLQIVWFLLVGVLLTVYAVLDGFDLGVGILQRFIGKTEPERRTMIGSVGPFWDGNEVWLLTGGGAIFAAFPQVYATVFSGFYLAMMLVVLGLMFRAVAIEFRNQVNGARWRNAWDWAVAVGSLIPALLYGVAIGNVVSGVPIDAHRNFAGTFFTLITPYTLSVGVLGLVMFLLHGALYLNWRLEAPLAARAGQVARAAWVVFIVLLLVVTVATVASDLPRLDNFLSYPAAWLVAVLLVAAVAYIGKSLIAGNTGRAFISSGVMIASLMGILGLTLFPNMLPASNDLANSLTVYNASSSQLTLQIMLILAVIGVPIVLAYTWFIYRLFLGKEQPGENVARQGQNLAHLAKE